MGNRPSQEEYSEVNFMGDLYNPFPKLPKNIRQIGDTDQVIRFYMEDYVNTYLKRLYPVGNQALRVGLLLGNVEQYDGTPYIFVDGAMEMEGVETDGEKIVFTENAWKKAYQAIEETFPKRTIQGWFLCGGPGSQLSPLNYWKQHGQYFAGKNQLMYLNHGLEGEEAIYITSDDGFYRLKGHCIYYERNQMMQDYMITRKDVRRVETGSHEKVIKDFRQRMVAKKEQAARESHKTSALGMLCGVLSVAVLAGGVVLVNNYGKMQRMESVLTSVLPAGVSNWDEYQKQKAEEPDFIIEELPGNVYPTENVTGETGEFYGAETMASTEDGGEGGDEAAGQDAAGASGQGGAGGQSAAGGAGEGAGNAGAGGQSGTASQDAASTGGQNAAGGAGNESGNAGAGGQSGSANQDAANAGSQSDPGAVPQAADADSTVIEEAVPVPEDSNSGQGQNLVGMGKEEGQGDAPETTRPVIDYAAAEANGYRIYEVGEGETLYGICLQVYGSLSRLSEVCSLNYLEDENRILAGQKLILP